MQTELEKAAITHVTSHNLVGSHIDATGRATVDDFTDLGKAVLDLLLWAYVVKGNDLELLVISISAALAQRADREFGPGAGEQFLRAAAMGLTASEN